MNKNNSILKLTLIYSIGNFSSKIITFVLFFFVTFYLSKSEIGEYDVLLSSIQLFTPIVSIQLHESIFRWLIDNVKNEKKTFSNIIFLLFLSIVASTVIYFIITYFYSINNPLLILILIISNSIFPVLHQSVRGLGDNVTYSVSGIIHSIIYTLFTILAVVGFKMKIEGLILANICTNIITSCFIILKTKMHKLISINYFNYKYCVEILKYSIPLIPTSLSSWIITNANRYFILAFIGTEANGSFAVTYKFPSIVLMINWIFIQAWQEKALMSYNNPEKNIIYFNILTKYNNALLSLIIVLTAFSKSILIATVQTVYYNVWIYIPILYIAVYFSSISTFYGVGYMINKNTNKAFNSSFIGGIITVITSFILVPILKLQGVGLSMIIGQFVTFFIRYRSLKDVFSMKFPLFETSILFAVLLVTISINYLENVTLINIIQCIFITPVIIYFNKYILRQYLIKITELLSRLFFKYKYE